MDHHFWQRNDSELMAHSTPPPSSARSSHSSDAIPRDAVTFIRTMIEETGRGYLPKFQLCNSTRSRKNEGCVICVLGATVRCVGRRRGACQRPLRRSGFNQGGRIVVRSGPVFRIHLQSKVESQSRFQPGKYASSLAEFL